MTEYERLLELKKEMQEKKRKRICMFSCLGAAVISLGAVTFLLVTDGFSSNVEEVTEDEAAAEAVITEESALLAVSMNNASEEEYSVAVQYYFNQGDDIKARDLLEECYETYGNQDALDMLDDIYIDVAKDTQAVQYMASELETNARTDGYFAEIFHLFQDELWGCTMAPVASATVRNYYLVLADDSQIYFTVTKDSESSVASQLWQEIDGNFQYVSFDDNTAQFIEVAMENPEIGLSSDLISQLKAGDNSFYNGAYTCCTLDAATGGVTLVTATANAGELNDLVEKSHEGVAAADVYDLWNSRENYSYTTVKDEREAAESNSSAAASNSASSGAKKKSASSSSSNSNKTSSKTSNSTSANSTSSSSTDSTSKSTNTSSGTAATSGNTSSASSSTTTPAATTGGSSAGSTSGGNTAASTSPGSSNAGQTSAGASSTGTSGAGTSTGTGSTSSDTGSGTSGTASSGSSGSASSGDAGASSGGGSAAPSTSGTDTDAGWTSDLL